MTSDMYKKNVSVLIVAETAQRKNESKGKSLLFSTIVILFFTVTGNFCPTAGEDREWRRSFRLNLVTLDAPGQDSNWTSASKDRTNSSPYRWPTVCSPRKYSLVELTFVRVLVTDADVDQRQMTLAFHNSRASRPTISKETKLGSSNVRYCPDGPNEWFWIDLTIADYRTPCINPDKQRSNRKSFRAVCSECENFPKPLWNNRQTGRDAFLIERDVEGSRTRWSLTFAS